MKNLVLIGLPGCGKTSFGKKLAAALGRPFYDADEVLEEREGRSIKSFFAESEEAFRRAESRTLAYLAALDGCVIACGGGAVKRRENMEALGAKGCIVFLERSPEAILAAGSIDGDERPLLAAAKEKIFTLYRERIGLYRRYGAYTVDNEGSEENTLAQLLKIAEQEAGR